MHALVQSSGFIYSLDHCIPSFIAPVIDSTLYLIMELSTSNTLVRFLLDWTKCYWMTGVSWPWNWQPIVLKLSNNCFDCLYIVNAIWVALGFFSIAITLKSSIAVGNKLVSKQLIWANLILYSWWNWGGSKNLGLLLETFNRHLT